MDSIDKLSKIFSQFPGIGPRQAKRFVFFLLARNGDYHEGLMKALKDLKNEIIQCEACMRFFARDSQTSELCSICRDETRDRAVLMVVPRDIDFEAVERSGSHKGLYFILGGAIPILEKEPEKRIRAKELDLRIKKDKNIKEIILAMNANLDGENTADFIKQKYKNSSLVFSSLGRGLSTGSELEYVDPDTLKNAYLHRTK